MNDKFKMFEIYLREEEKADNTIDKYLRDINEFYKWFEFVGANACGALITKDVLLDYKEHLKKSKLKVSTINSKISSLNAFFTHTENETLKLKVIKCQKSLFGSKERELTKKEYKRLYDTCKCNEKLKLIIETIAKTGIRVSELEYITYESLKAGKAIVNNKGKVRIILIPKKLCIKLMDYYNKSCGKFVGADTIRPIVGENNRSHQGGLIFTTRNGLPIDRKQIWVMMKKLAEKANVDKNKVFPHNLRHLFAREFYKATHDIVKLASLMGHSSIETTRIYTKETEDECREVLEKLDFVT